MIALACSTLSCDGFEDTDFVESFRLMPGIGFTYVEFNCWYPRTLTPAKMRDLKRRCEQAGLVPASIHSSGFGGDNNFDLNKDVAHKLRMIDAALELGVRRVCATGQKRGTSGGLDAIVEVLREVAPYAEEKDVLIGLENHQDNTIETIEDYEYILERIDSSHVGVCLDTGHFEASGVNMDDLIDRLGPRVNQIHLKDNNGFGTKAFVRFGEGTTPISHVVERMISDGYEGFLSIELSPTGDPTTIPEDLRKAIELYGHFQTY